MNNETVKNQENKSKAHQEAAKASDKQPVLTSKVDEAGNYVFDHDKVNALLEWAISKTKK